MCGMQLTTKPMLSHSLRVKSAVDDTADRRRQLWPLKLCSEELEAELIALN